MPVLDRSWTGSQLQKRLLQVLNSFPQGSYLNQQLGCSYGFIVHYLPRFLGLTFSGMPLVLLVFSAISQPHFSPRLQAA